MAVMSKVLFESDFDDLSSYTTLINDIHAAVLDPAVELNHAFLIETYVRIKLSNGNGPPPMNAVWARISHLLAQVIEPRLPAELARLRCWASFFALVSFHALSGFLPPCYEGCCTIISFAACHSLVTDLTIINAILKSSASLPNRLSSTTEVGRDASYVLPNCIDRKPKGDYIVRFCSCSAYMAAVVDSSSFALLTLLVAVLVSTSYCMRCADSFGLAAKTPFLSPSLTSPFFTIFNHLPPISCFDLVATDIFNFLMSIHVAVQTLANVLLLVSYSIVLGLSSNMRMLTLPFLVSYSGSA